MLEQVPSVLESLVLVALRVRRSVVTVVAVAALFAGGPVPARADDVPTETPTATADPGASAGASMSADPSRPAEPTTSVDPTTAAPASASAALTAVPGDTVTGELLQAYLDPAPH